MISLLQMVLILAALATVRGWDLALRYGNRQWRRLRAELTTPMFRRAVVMNSVWRLGQTMVLWGLVSGLHLHPVPANILSVAGLFVVGYLISKYWVFKVGGQR